MKLNYSKEQWEKIPEEIRKMDTTELDFTDHDERELHKLELDRRLYLMSDFLSDYRWDGTHRDETMRKRNKITSNTTTTSSKSMKKEQKPQSDLEAFIQDA